MEHTKTQQLAFKMKSATRDFQPSTLTSPLRWAGGKRFIAPAIRLILQNTDTDDTLIEVFAGSLALSFALQPSKIIANDILTPLINFLERIKNGELIDAGEAINIENSQSNFIANRTAFNDINRGVNPTTVTEAALFYYLNRTCFNGLCRFSKKTGFNVGWGKLKKPVLIRDFTKHKEVLKNAEIYNLPFSDFNYHGKGLRIIDPPYYGNFTGYTGGGFDLNHQIQLAEMYSHSSFPLIAFNSSHPTILKLYKELGYDVFLYEAPRKISRNGDRKPAIEMFATKNISKTLVLRSLESFKIKELPKIVELQCLVCE